jgi:acetyl-CoA acetyltransferase family protein
LGRRVVRETLERSGTPADRVDEIIVGNAGTPSDAPNIARVIGLMAGLPESTPGLTVHRNCASGMEAVILAAAKITSGEARLIVAAGTENLSRAPMVLPPEANPWFVRWSRARSIPAKLAALRALRPRDMMPHPALLDGLTDPVCGLSMGRTAEVLAREFGISREEQDEFALSSHLRAVDAWEDGRIAEEVTPVFVGPGFKKVIEKDVGPRENQTTEALSGLRPVFERRDGTVTAGHSCQVTDGAAAVVVASEDYAAELGLTPVAKILGTATAGLSPRRMGLGPAYATPLALDHAGVRMADIDRIEINEAFAAQVIANERAFASDRFASEELGRASATGEIRRDRLNADGGAIALGHPIGATGTRLVVTLLRQLRQSGGALGLATLCVGGGQGSAIVMERVS